MHDAELMLTAIRQDGERLRHKRFHLKSFDMPDIKRQFPDAYETKIGYQRLIEEIGRIESIRDFDEQHIDDYKRISDTVDKIVRELDFTAIQTGDHIRNFEFPVSITSGLDVDDEESTPNTLTGVMYRIRQITSCNSRSVFYAPATYCGMVFEFSIQHKYTALNEQTIVNSIWTREKYDITGIKLLISAIPLDKSAFLEEWLPALNLEKNLGSKGARVIFAIDPERGTLEYPDKNRLIIPAWNYYNQSVAEGLIDNAVKHISESCLDVFFPKPASEPVTE